MLSNFFNNLVKTNSKNYAIFFLRVAAAMVILPHGAQKVLGWFGGHGFNATYSAFTSGMGIPSILALLAILAESLGGLLLLLGLLSRVSAFGIATTMIVASTMHFQNGFFMNWYGNAAGEGFEYHILMIAITTVLAIRGGGALALDNLLSSKVKETKQNELELQVN